jgi:aryl-alcohol dehydrogenase-like predicted oxidoreductase
VDKLDLLYPHIEDPVVAPRETVEGFAELVAEATVGLLGVSNHAMWPVERARASAAAGGLPGYEVLHYRHSHLRRRTTCPTGSSRTAASATPDPTCLSYLRAEPDLALVAYSPLLGGAYARARRRLGCVGRVRSTRGRFSYTA